MNYKNRIYDTVTTYMKKLSELDGLAGTRRDYQPRTRHRAPRGMGAGAQGRL